MGSAPSPAPSRVAPIAAVVVAAALAPAAPVAYAMPGLRRGFAHTAAVPTGRVGTAEEADLTDFEAVLLPPRSDPADGARITPITATLSGGVFGDSSASATDPTADRFYRDRTVDVSAAVAAASPDPSATPLGVVLPLVPRAFGLAPRRAVGRGNLSGSAASTRTTDAKDPDFDAFAPLFLGTGTVALPVSAVGTSRFSGPGDVRFAADTLAGAVGNDCVAEAGPTPVPAGGGGGAPVPEPTRPAVLGVGLLGTLAPRRGTT